MRLTVLLLIAGLVTASCRRSPPPEVTIRADDASPADASAAQCTESCPQGLCWEGHEEFRLAAPRSGPMAFAGEWLVWTDGSGVHARNGRTGARKELGLKRATEVSTAGTAVAWNDGDGLHYGLSLDSVRTIAPARACDRAGKLAIHGGRVLVSCDVIATVPGSTVISDITVTVDSFSPSGERRRLGEVSRDPQREPPLVAFEPDGKDVVINDRDNVVRRRLDALSDPGDIVHAFGNDWYVLSIARLGDGFLTEIHNCPMDAYCANPKVELHLVRADGSARSLGNIPGFVSYPGLVSTGRHALIPIGRRLFHTPPEGPLQELAMELPAPSDAGAMSSIRGVALSDCGAVAISHQDAILVRGVRNW